MVPAGPCKSLMVLDGPLMVLDSPWSPCKSCFGDLRKASRLRTRDENYMLLLKALAERGVFCHDVPWKGNCAVFAQEALSSQRPLAIRERYQEKDKYATLSRFVSLIRPYKAL